jgi:hypothetical protein
MSSGSCVQRLQPPCGIEKGLWLKSICAGLLVQLVHREVDDPAEAEDVLLDQAELRPSACGAAPASLAAAVRLVGDEEHRVAVAAPQAAREAATLLGFEELGDRAPARRPPRQM